MANDSDFLGQGWMFPLAVQNTGIALAADADDVRQSILLILSTSPGERVMLPEFGTSLNELVFAPMNQATFTLAETKVTQALEKWEPRITQIEVNVEQDTSAAGQLLIQIQYMIRGSNVAQNLGYPFYLQGGGDLSPGYQTDAAQ